jgi:KaiC/GvpD/RAD55 family RecA-like ATPase
VAVDSPRPFLVPVDRVEAPVRPSVPDSGLRIPTGVPDFDYLTGGLPLGSVVLLFGEAGAGHQEFALTSAAHLMLHFDDPKLHQFYLGSAKGPFAYPSGVTYISVSRSQDQVLREVSGSFEGNYAEVLQRHLKFFDISAAYFADSLVPPGWSSVPSPLLTDSAPPDLSGTPSTLRALTQAIESGGNKQLLILDSLTDLLVRRGVEPEELLTLLKGLRRRAKAWGGIVYVILSKGVASPATEQAVIDSVDGVLAFAWISNPLHSHRQRSMVIEKFMPVLSRVPSDHQGRFVIRVSPVSGLVTTQYERI